MKRFIVSIFAAACTFLLLIILSFWGKSVYLEGVQKQAGHLMQFLNEYVVQSKRGGKYVKSEEMAKQLSAMADCRICLFPPTATCLPIPIQPVPKSRSCISQSAT